MQETHVWSTGWEDSQKKMATHSSILAWRIPWIEEPGWLQFKGLQRVGHNWATNTTLLPISSHFLTTVLTSLYLFYSFIIQLYIHRYYSLVHLKTFDVFLFYWSVVDLQCCISFTCTAKWFSYTYCILILFSYRLSQNIE